MRALATALVVPFAMSLSACSKPEPPVLTPERASVKSIGPTGIDFVVAMRAKNPNRVDLNIQSVTAKVTIDGSVDLGTTTIASPIALPAGAETPLHVPVSFRWTNLPAIARLGAARRDVPYSLEGNVTIGGSALSVTLPFTMTGTLKHEDLTKAAVNSLPAQLRGLVPDLSKPITVPQ